MTTIGLTQCLEFAKANTKRAKEVKAWRLRKADRILQALEMPKGYIIATGAEIREILVKAGKHTCMSADDIKGVWALNASFPDHMGKVEIGFMPIACAGNN